MKQSIFDIQHLHLKDYLFKLFPAGELVGKEFTIGDIYGNQGQSLRFNIEKGCGQDFATGQIFKSIVDLIMEKFNLEEQEAFKKIEGDWAMDNTNVVKLVKEKKPQITPQTFSADEPLTLAYWQQKQIGNVKGRWLYTDKEGKGLCWIVRFDKDGQKDYYPYIKGEDGKWHQQHLEKPRPLYNLKELHQADKKNIILVVEGEKAAEAAKLKMPTLTPTTWLGGANAVKNSDWSVLAGKKVLIWRDHDLKTDKKTGELLEFKEQPGKKAELQIADILVDLGCVVRVFKDDAFNDMPDGWDIADCELEGQELASWIKNNIMEYLRGGADSSASTPEATKSAHVSDEPLGQHYRCLGLAGNRFVLYNYHSGQVVSYSPDALSKKTLIALVSGDVSYWARLAGIPDDEGKVRISWDSIVGVLAKDCYKLGQFDQDRVRGLGCWIDNKRVVFNAGDFLYVEGHKIPINDFESYYIYTRNASVIQNMSKEVNRHELTNLAQLCNLFSWEYPVSGCLLAGWLMIAPICGALPWRPHIYITGMAGTGKSTIHDNLLARVLGNCSIVTLGDSTKAGLAQSVMSDALPIIFDEIENDSKLDEMRNDTVLRMARYSSSSQKGKTLKGRADQSGAEGYVCRSSFCFSSISPSVKHYADFSRITLLPLAVSHNVSKETQIKHFKVITDMIKNLLGDDVNSLDFSERFITYANRNAKIIIESYKVIKETAQLKIDNFNARIADQVGMLLAGYWLYLSDKVITAEEAEEILKKHNWEDLIPNKRQENQMQLVSKLMQHKVFFQNDNSQKRFTRTIAELLDYVSYPLGLEHKDAILYERTTAEDLLMNLGIKLEPSLEHGMVVLISNTSQQLQKILEGTQWSTNWAHSLKAINGAYSEKLPKYFGKSIGQQRCTAVPLNVMLASE